MKYVIMVSALLVLVAIGCKKESGDAKKETPATKTGDPPALDAGKAEPAKADAATEPAKTEPAKPEPVPAPPEEAKPLSDDECKALVKEIATCGTGKTASEDFRSWIGMALFMDEQSASGSKQLDKELASWKKDPERVCNIFRENSEDEPMFSDNEAAIRDALTKHDCAALQDAAEDLPWPQEGE